MSPYQRGSAAADIGGGEVQERAQQLVTERQALREAWEKRNKKLKQCCELQVQIYTTLLKMHAKHDA